MKLFRKTNIDHCGAELPDTVTEQRTGKFRNNYRSCDKLYCTCKLLCDWCSVWSLLWIVAISK